MKAYICTNVFGDYEERYRRGERQGYCLECRRWQFPDECAHDKVSQAEFNKVVRAVAQETRRKFPTQEDKYRAAVNEVGGQP